jgi:hypothetical protein
MPLSEFTAPAVTEQYLSALTKDQLVELLLHKTNGLLVAARLKLTDFDATRSLLDEVKKIQAAIKARSN